MKNAFTILKQRGFIAQITDEEAITKKLQKPTVFYAGFDPTADSLHVGHLLPVMAMSHLQKKGHKPIALIGGGTAMIGDPTGKEEMRKMLKTEKIDNNISNIKRQLEKLIDISDDKGVYVNNAEWIRDLNYVDFLRDIGIHFSVNRMLTAECFKQRLEKGLSFIEFNYMLLQAYDFLFLNRKYNCSLQIGGDDQWSNMLAGMDLIRRKDQKDVHGFTVTLITTSNGKKMGKTEKGAVWLDSNKTSVFDYYQYWRNTHDDDVIKFLKLFTFLDLENIKELSMLEGKSINQAKKVLAFEATKIIHGQKQAQEAQNAAESLFESGQKSGSVPTTEFSLRDNTIALDLFRYANIISSNSEGRRLIKQKGLSINGKVVENYDMIIDKNFADKDNIIKLKKGKKIYHHIKLI